MTTPDTTQILSIIHRILQDDLGLLLDLSPTLLKQSLQQDLKLDSLQMVTLQVSVEDAFALYFDPIEHDLISIFATIGSLVEHIQAHYPGSR